MPMPLHDLRGHRFGMLVVTSRGENSKSGAVRWNCDCDCGTVTTVAAGSLRNGTIRSCGCLNTKAGRRLRQTVERTKSYQQRDPLTVKFRREYNSWVSMRARCENTNDPKYALYGGRGITVCEKWKVFSAFLEDMGHRPLGKTLDRVNPDGHYEKSNCQWSTTEEQQEHRRHTKFVTDAAGNRVTLSSFARTHGVSARALLWHVRAGHDVTKCVVAMKTKTGYRVRPGSCS